MLLTYFVCYVAYPVQSPYKHSFMLAPPKYWKLTQWNKTNHSNGAPRRF
jgi:hypothetical protein